jgi:glycosyltransferase involved in cell wall biosynthesis
MGANRLRDPMPHKLLFLVNTLNVGGAERNVALFCRHIDRSRFEPEVWVLRGGGQFEDRVKRTGIRIRNFDRRWARNPWFALKMAREISRSDAELVHAFLPSIAIYGAFARRWFGLRQPLILSLGQAHAGRTERWMFRTCRRPFDWLIANSRSAQELGKSLGFAADRMSLIPNGHEIDEYQRVIDRERIRASVGVGLQERMLLCVGRLIASKRVCDAVAAMELLQEPAKLVIVGDGPERGALRADISRRGLNGKVVLVGERSDVADLLLAADYFLFPSESEGLPNALIEACLAGLPIVACHVGGVSEVVMDRETALLVPPRNPPALAAALRRLLTDRGEAERVAAAAQARAKKRYAIEQSLNALYDVYDRLLCERQRGAQEQVAGVSAPGCC